MKRWLRDWWRGYSDADYESMLKKMAGPELRKPGSMMRVTYGELRAYRAMHQDYQ